MSSPGSAVTVELPRWALADRLALGLIVAAGVVLEVVLANLAGAPRGIGVLATAVGLVGIAGVKLVDFGPVGFMDDVALLRQHGGFLGH